MYEAHWHLASKPFENNSDENFYYPSEAHQGALLKLRYAVENRRGAALLSGGAGLGKTMLVHALRRQLGEDYAPFVHLVFPEMPPDELLTYLADQLTGACTSAAASTQESVRRIEQALRDNVESGKHAVVVVDEAQLLRETRALETIRLLLNFECDGQPGMTMLLVGQPSLLPTLDRMPQLNGRLGVKCLLRPFSLDESIAYVEQRLAAAGAQQAIFDRSALEAVHYFAHGAPREINRLCDLSLLIGFAEERDEIGAEQIEAVADELLTVSPE